MQFSPSIKRWKKRFFSLSGLLHLLRGALIDVGAVDLRLNSATAGNYRLDFDYKEVDRLTQK
jgi:hypothetical protein